MTSRLFQSDSTRWAAVQQRDPAADGVFVYAVKTTKIYCRPVCKARLARRANVCFYPTAREAERGGFRACKRCKPHAVGAMPEEAAITKIRSMIQQEQANSQQVSGDEWGGRSDASERAPRSLADMARKAKLSKWHFHRAFKDTMGLTPSEWLEQQRKRSIGPETLVQDVPGHPESENAGSGCATPGTQALGGLDGMADSTALYLDSSLAGLPSDITWEADRLLLELDLLIPSQSLSPSVSGDSSPATVNGHGLCDPFLHNLPDETQGLFLDINLDNFFFDPTFHNVS